MRLLPPPLHVRDDEERGLDELSHQVDPEFWFYGGCKFCGQEDHHFDRCPNRPHAA